MPQAHFRCPTCLTLTLLTYRMVDTEGDWPPHCPRCAIRLERAPQPGDFTMDLRTDGAGSRGFQKFSIHRQVPTRTGLRQVEEQIDSLHALRKIEHDSEQRFKDGEGEPLRFRAYQQDGSNLDVNSFGTEGKIGDRAYDSGQQPVRSGKVDLRRHGQTKPKIPLGPGLRRAGTPLKG